MATKRGTKFIEKEPEAVNYRVNYGLTEAIKKEDVRLVGTEGEIRKEIEVKVVEE